jgi:hypothetical protein
MDPSFAWMGASVHGGDVASDGALHAENPAKATPLLSFGLFWMM